MGCVSSIPESPNLNLSLNTGWVDAASYFPSARMKVPAHWQIVAYEAVSPSGRFVQSCLGSVFISDS